MPINTAKITTNATITRTALVMNSSTGFSFALSDWGATFAGATEAASGGTVTCPLQCLQYAV